MVVALIALFVALSGVAVAGVTLSNNTVRSNNIVNGQVKNADLATNSVGKLKIKNNAVDSAKIADGAVADADIAGVAGAKVTGTVANAAAAANADKLDNLDSTQLKPRWAIVATDGTIIAQSGGFSMTTSGGGGFWINAGAPVNARPIHATQRFGLGGMIQTAACGNGAGGGADTVTCLAAGSNNVNHLYVETKDITGTLAARSFYVSIDNP
jgi:hypothetical protein